MDILGMIFGWKWKLQRTRRRWDRLREHALEKEGRIKHEALKHLDETENKLRIIEEEKLSRRDRVKMLREINMELANTRDLLENGEAWLSDSHLQYKLAQKKAHKQD